VYLRTLTSPHLNIKGKSSFRRIKKKQSSV
jgi:hypothetical protein